MSDRSHIGPVIARFPSPRKALKALGLSKRQRGKQRPRLRTENTIKVKTPSGVEVEIERVRR